MKPKKLNKRVGKQKTTKSLNKGVLRKPSKKSAQKRRVAGNFENYNWRYLVVGMSLFSLSLALTVRVVYLQVIDREFLEKQANARILRSEKISAHRGIITDRDGRPLAVSTPVVSLWGNPKEMISEQEGWQVLAKALGMSHRDLKNKVLKNQNKSFVYLKRHLPPDAADEVLALNSEGVYKEVEYRRFYPAGEVAAHIVGLTNIDDKGIEGVELAYEETLRGEAGRRKVLKSRKGDVIKDIGITQYANPGEDLALSVDLRAQYITYKELSRAVDRFKAKSASAVAIDVESGEILALVNKPSFNPNNRKNVKADSLRNRVVTDLFEPGSTVKPFTVLSALESGKFKANSKLDTRPGYMKIGSKTIRDHRNYGVIDLTTVLTKSSNVATSKLALALEKGDLQRMMTRIGFGDSLETGLPGESSGLMPDEIKTRPIEVASLSYGYGVSITAMQLANAYNILANDGIEKPISIIKQYQTPKGERVVSKNDAQTIIKMLETVVSEKGTASLARVQGYSVAGKTGTVHRIVNGKYAEDQYTSLFAGLAPAKDPKVVLVVVINNPKGDEYYGGLVAAPTFSRIMESILRIMDVDPDNPDIFEADKQLAKAA